MKKTTILTIGVLAASLAGFYSPFSAARPAKAQQKTGKKILAPVLGGTQVAGGMQIGGAMQVKITDGTSIQGTSAVANHLGWFDIIAAPGQEVMVSNFPHGDANKPYVTGGRWNSTGKDPAQPEPKLVTILIKADQSSRQLEQLASTSRPISEVVIDLFQPGSSYAAARRVQLQQVVVSSVQMVPQGAGEGILERVTFTAKGVSESYPGIK